MNWELSMKEKANILRTVMEPKAKQTLITKHFGLSQKDIQNRLGKITLLQARLCASSFSAKTSPESAADMTKRMMPFPVVFFNARKLRRNAQTGSCLF